MTLRFLGITCLLLLPHAASAELYGGFGVGISTLEYSNIDSGFAKQAYLGYRKRKHHFAYELSTIYSGKADIENGGTLLVSSGGGNQNIEKGFYEINGVTASAIYNTNNYFSRANPFNGYFRLGAYSVNTEVEAQSSDLVFRGNIDNHGISYGAGIEYALSKRIGLRVDWQSLLEVDDAADNETVSWFTVNTRIRF